MSFESFPTSDLSTAVAVTREIIEVHQAFVHWFTGQCPCNSGVFFERISSRFDSQFKIVFPSGTMLTKAQLFDKMYAGHGQNPGFAIQIRNIEVWPVGPNEKCIYATYEEWMKHSRNSDPPNNGRITTVIFDQVSGNPNGLRWRHVHETWLPKALTDAEEYDF